MPQLLIKEERFLDNNLEYSELAALFKTLDDENVLHILAIAVEHSKYN